MAPGDHVLHLKPQSRRQRDGTPSLPDPSPLWCQLAPGARDGVPTGGQSEQGPQGGGLLGGGGRGWECQSCGKEGWEARLRDNGICVWMEGEGQRSGRSLGAGDPQKLLQWIPGPHLHWEGPAHHWACLGL